MVANVERVAIVGAGHARVECAVELCQRKFTGAIELISDETDLPYQRPPLSKDYIKRGGNPLVMKPAQFYADNGVALRLNDRAVAVDRASREVRLASGKAVPYDHLVIATGARNRKPPILGLDHHAVIELRTLADANRIIGVIGSWKRVAIIGAGFIGLEAAGLLAMMNVAVDVIETAPRPMQRAVSPTTSAWFLHWHRRHGVRVHLEKRVTAVAHGRQGALVSLSTRETLDVDAVILAAGVVPNAELAAAAGLEIANGIVVDRNLLTSDPCISAIGDCAIFPSPHSPGMVRLESVQNAGGHGRAVAARLTGEVKPYDTLPWFWSIQGDARLQIAGLSKPGLTETLRGDPSSEKFSVFLFEGDRLAAVESINAPADHMVARQLIAAGAKVDPAKAADLSTDLKSLA